MLDEMAIETQQEKGRHKEELGNLRLQHEKEMLAVRARYERELRELHEHKKRQEDELRGQLKEEKVPGPHSRFKGQKFGLSSSGKLSISRHIL